MKTCYSTSLSLKWVADCKSLNKVESRLKNTSSFSFWSVWLWGQESMRSRHSLSQLFITLKCLLAHFSDESDLNGWRLLSWQRKQLQTPAGSTLKQSPLCFSAPHQHSGQSESATLGMPGKVSWIILIQAADQNCQFMFALRTVDSQPTL